MKKKNILIMSLCFILLVMGIGYSAFSSKLNINSSSSITSNWDVEITSIEKTNVSGNVVEKDKSFTKDTATFNVEMEKPGNYVYYKIGVTNKGSIDAIATFGNLTCTNTAFECGAYTDGNVTKIETNTNLTDARLIISANETEYYNVYIKFKSEITSMPNNLTNTLNLNLTYKQSDVGTSHKTEDNCYTSKMLKNGTLSITDYNASCGTNVVIPETIDGYTVTEIADGIWDDNLGKNFSAFANKGITSVTMPDTIIKIGSMAFIHNNITDLKLSENLETINSEAFMGNKLQEVKLPASLKYIGQSSFYSNNLTTVDIPESVTTLGGGAFASNNLKGENAFIYGRNSNGTTNYTVLNSYASKGNLEMSIPSTIKTIAYRCFRGAGITEIDIPSNVEEIGGNAFTNVGLKKVTLHEGLKTISYLAFRGNSLTEITIPNTVEIIGTEAFRWNKLTKVTIGSGIKTMSSNAFKAEDNYNQIESFTINKTEGSITGSPWGSNATINWIG